MLWEIGHVGWFHEYWTLRHAHGRAPLIERGDRLWDSSAVAHATRWQLDLPDRAGTFGYMADVLAQPGGPAGRRRRRPSALLLRSRDPPRGHACRGADLHRARRWLCAAGRSRAARVAPGAGALPGDVAVPGGTLAARLDAPPTASSSTTRSGRTRPTLAPFRIARAPVTNAEFAAFVEEGGYRAREFWSDAGWDVARSAARRAAGLLAGQARRRVDARGATATIEALAPHAPVCFVNWFEADAWCRWAGRRLPSEAEWEAAAIGVPDGGRHAAGRPAPPLAVGRRAADAARAPISTSPSTGRSTSPALAAGDSAFGCRQMIGNVWEWTASDFLPFAGFAADPYKDYSQPWFGTRKVLRGGCWATSARIARPAYRNFFTPDRSDVLRRLPHLRCLSVVSLAAR